MTNLLRQTLPNVVGLLRPTTALFLLMALAGVACLGWWLHTEILDTYSTPTLSEFHADLPNVAGFEQRILSVQEPEEIEQVIRQHTQSVERLNALNERFAVAMHEEAWVCAITPSDLQVFIAAVSENDRRNRALLESLHTLIVAEIAAQQRRTQELPGGAVHRAIEKKIIELDELLYALSKDRAYAHAVLLIITNHARRLQSIRRVCRDGNDHLDPSRRLAPPLSR